MISSHTAAALGLALAMSLAGYAAGAQTVLKQVPPTGVLHCGEVVFVDNHKCPKDQILKVTGGCNFDSNGMARAGAPRTERCIARP